MANAQTFFNPVQTHYFQLDTDITAGLNSPVFTRNFRVLDMTVFVVTPAPGATLTVNRVRGSLVGSVAILDVSAAGRAVFTLDVSQSTGLFESGDVLQLITSAGGDVLDASVIIYLQQFSL